jgi:hypothetical protein
VAQATALCPQYQDNASSKVDLMGLPSPFGVGTYHPQARFLQQLQCPHKIRHGNDGRGLRSANGHLANSWGHLRGSITRYHHSDRAAGIRRTQTGAQVVGVLHSIERQDQWIGDRLQRSDQLVFRPRWQRNDFRGNALVGHIPQLLLQGLGVNALDGPVIPACQIIDLADSGIVATLGHTH